MANPIIPQEHFWNKTWFYVTFGLLGLFNTLIYGFVALPTNAWDVGVIFFSGSLFFNMMTKLAGGKT